MVVAEASQCATEAEIDALRGDIPGWAALLRRLIGETDESLTRSQRLGGDERDQVLADLRSERDRLVDALARLTGEEVRFDGDPVRLANEIVAAAPVEADEPELPAVTSLQGSWAAGRLVIWAGGPGVGGASAEVLDEMLGEVLASTTAWEQHPAVALPDGASAAARSAAVGQTLGWLVGIGAGQLVADAGASLRWLGEVAVWGTELVAQGRMVPVLKRSTQSAPAARRASVRYRVRWAPAVVDRQRLNDLVARMPGSVSAVDRAARPDGICRGLLSAVVDAVCRAGAERLVAPATVPNARTRSEVSEAVLSGLNGAAFMALPDTAADLAEELKRWAAPATAEGQIGLTVRLEPPEADGGWLLSVEATGVDRQPLPVEHALAAAMGAKVAQVEAQVRRVERLVPALRRPSSRRGQVILGSEEAEELMVHTGPALAAAGFDVQVPIFSRRRPGPRLAMFADADRGPAHVGAQQLARVRWSVVFDDLELNAADIARLAREASPLVRVRGKWVSLDKADLAAAASALAERSSMTELSGAAILRQAVGLGGGALGGPVSVEGSGWAVEVIKGATTNPPGPVEAPKGFVGKLRSYQAEAVGWLGFLDRAGLGGCLAMDMGLGKTPTVLAHLLATRGDGPALVICPPAVLGNWHREASSFTPGLVVRVHHGPNRAEAQGLVAMSAHADVVLTTYATAVRDLDAINTIGWRRVIVDEAQAIKNAQSETARALREIKCQTRLALTGTPVENGLGDLWSILDFLNPGLVGARAPFIEQLSQSDPGIRSTEEGALRALNGLLVFRRTKTEPAIAAELSDKIDRLEHCAMSAEQVGLYQAVLDRLLDTGLDTDENTRKGNVLAAITALKQICDHPSAYLDDDKPLEGRSGKLTRLEELMEAVFASGERMLIFTHFAKWGEKLATHLSRRMKMPIACYHGGLTRIARDKMVAEFQERTGPAALVLSLKAGGSGLNLTAANHVVLYDRWWNPAVEDQARDRAWRIGQTKTVVSHRLVCPGTVDERVEEVVAGKRRIADLVLPARSTLADVGREQLRVALGLDTDALLDDEPTSDSKEDQEAA